MLHTTSRVFSCTDLELPEVERRFWTALQEGNTHLPDLEQVGAGEIAAGQLRVRFIRGGQRELFAAEVADLGRGHWWEAGFARVGDCAWRAFWRDLSGTEEAPAEWQKAVQQLELVPTDCRVEPTFLSLAAVQLPVVAWCWRKTSCRAPRWKKN